VVKAAEATHTVLVGLADELLHLGPPGISTPMLQRMGAMDSRRWGRLIRWASGPPQSDLLARQLRELLVTELYREGWLLREIQHISGYKPL